MCPEYRKSHGQLFFATGIPRKTIFHVDKQLITCHYGIQHRNPQHDHWAFSYEIHWIINRAIWEHNLSYMYQQFLGPAKKSMETNGSQVGMPSKQSECYTVFMAQQERPHWIYGTRGEQFMFLIHCPHSTLAKLIDISVQVQHKLSTLPLKRKTPCEPDLIHLRNDWSNSAGTLQGQGHSSAIIHSGMNTKTL